MGGLLDCIRGRGGSPVGLEKRRKATTPSIPEWPRPSPLLPTSSPQSGPAPAAQGPPPPPVHSLRELCNANGGEPAALQQKSFPEESETVQTLGTQETSLGLEDCPFFSDPSSWLARSLSATAPEVLEEGPGGGGVGYHGVAGREWTGRRRLDNKEKPKAVRKLFPPVETSDHLISSKTTSDNDDALVITEDCTSLPSVATLLSSSHGTVDVNFANVHQLRVIGLTDKQAEAVVEGRARKGHFQSKEAVKQVGEIDDVTWPRVQPRITLVPAGLGATRNGGIKGSRAEVVRDQDAISGASPGGVSVDLNRCNYQELCVVGLNKSQAQAVVDHRYRNGPFSSTEDIKLLPCISEEAYRLIRHKLTLVPGKASPAQRLGGPSSSKKRRVRNGSLAVNSSPLHSIWNSPSTILPAFAVDEGEGASAEARCSPRGSGGKSSVRIASWNLQCFNEKKVENAGVLEVVCSTILQHGFDIVAVQEVGSKVAVEKVCQELNHPHLPKVLSWEGTARQWECCVSAKPIGRMYQGMEYCGLLWNKKSGVTFKGADVIESSTDFGEDRPFVRKPFVGKFSVRDWEFMVISVHLKAEGWGGKFKGQVETEVQNLSSLMKSISHQVRGSDVLLLGDFNMHPNSTCFQQLRDCDYEPLFGGDEPTNISACNPDGNMCYDNMWASPSIVGTRHRTGTRGVVRRGLQHPSIDTGRSRGAGECRGGTVSDHCPIWAGFVA